MDFTDVEKRLERLASLRHEELMPLLESSQQTLAKISQNVDLSESGRRKQIETARAEITEKLGALEGKFEKESSDLPARIDALVAHFEKGASDADESIDIDFDGYLSEADKALLIAQKRGERQLEKLVSTLNETRQETLLLKEIDAMTPDELIRFAEEARKRNDNVAFDLLGRFGKRRMTAGGDVQAAARFSNLMQEWSSERVPAHIRRAAQLKVENSRLAADWRLFLKEVKSQLGGR